MRLSQLETLMNAVTHMIDYEHEGRLSRTVYLPMQPVPVALTVAAVFAITFATVRDTFAPGVPDAQMISLAVYPGFITAYSSGTLGLLNDSALMLLFCISAGMLLLSGILVSCFASGKMDIIWGTLSALTLIVAADVQTIFPYRESEATIRSLIIIKNGEVYWSTHRLLIGASLVLIGVLAGCGFRYVTHRYRRREKVAEHLPIAIRFRGLLIVLGTFVLCRVGFVIARDLVNLGGVASCFTLYPWHFLANSKGSLFLALIAITCLLTVGFAMGLSVRPRPKIGVTCLILAIPSLVVLDAAMSIEWRMASIQGMDVLLGMILAIVIIAATVFTVFILKAIKNIVAR